MKLGRIVGTVVSTRKDRGVDGLSMFVVRDLTVDVKPGSGVVVAVDAVGAGEGEVVLYCTGSSARQTEITKDRPVDAVIMAIVDSVEVAGNMVYDKRADE